MAYGDQGRRLSAGCGAPGCGCTAARISAQFEKDRDEVSDRAAAVTERSLQNAARVIGSIATLRRSPGSRRPSARSPSSSRRRPSATGTTATVDAFDADQQQWEGFERQRELDARALAYSDD